MFTSLSISNFRNLDELLLNSLVRVNLITGKNNAGKSSLLEAIALYSSNFDLQLVDQLLEDRGENYYKQQYPKVDADANLKAISSLFSRQDFERKLKQGIKIVTDESQHIGLFNSNDFVADAEMYGDVLNLRVVKFVDEYTDKDDVFSSVRKRNVVDETSPDGDFKVGLEVTTTAGKKILSFDDERFFRRSYLREGKKSTPLQFIRPRSIDRDTNANLWDSITLTPKEASVVEALRIIDPTIERLAFVNAGGTNRSAVVKLKNLEQPLPLRSMGDGINRILTIVLALVNAENGYLLIDEFENGLHHSVQLNLWKILIPLAAKLNVQIFATTHNDDCIAAFGAALTTTNAQQDGKLIRLASKNGTVQAVEFDSNALKIAIDNNIEIR